MYNTVVRSAHTGFRVEGVRTNPRLRFENYFQKIFFFLSMYVYPLLPITHAAARALRRAHATSARAERRSRARQGPWASPF